MTRERIELNRHGESDNPLRDHGGARSWSNGHSEVRTLAPIREDLPAAVSIDLENDDEAQFLRTERRVPVRRGPVGKKTALRLKATILLAVTFALLGCLAWAIHDYGMHAEHFRIESSDNIDISGVHNASRAQVVEVIGSDIGRNVFRVPLDVREKQLEQIPWVESASVMRVLPNRIAVSITERTPVAFVLIGSRTSLIDANGVMMGPPASRQTRYQFPVIRGLAETEALTSRAAVMKIYNRLVRELDSSPSDQHFMRQISEVDLADPEDVKVNATSDGGMVLIHLGASDFLERYTLYAAHIGEWRRQYHNVQSVDLRYEGQIIVNPDAEHGPPSDPEATVKPPLQNQATVQAKTAVSHPAHSPAHQKKQQKRGSKK